MADVLLQFFTVIVFKQLANIKKRAMPVVHKAGCLPRLEQLTTQLMRIRQAEAAYNNIIVGQSKCTASCPLVCQGSCSAHKRQERHAVTMVFVVPGCCKRKRITGMKNNPGGMPEHAEVAGIGSHHIARPLPGSKQLLQRRIAV